MMGTYGIWADVTVVVCYIAFIQIKSSSSDKQSTDINELPLPATGNTEPFTTGQINANANANFKDKMMTPFKPSTDNILASLFLSALKYPNNPFHQGEIHLQIATGKQDQVMSYAPKFIRSYMPEQHREFYAALPFLVVAARDNDGRMWATLLEQQSPPPASSPPPSQGEIEIVPLATSPDNNTLRIASQPLQGDALFGALQTATDVGILGIQLETARRNRLNGHITAVTDDNHLLLKVDQSFGNCPQYIRTRESWYSTTPSTTVHQRSERLSSFQIQQIQSAETVFTASGYPRRRSSSFAAMTTMPTKTEDERSERHFGNDASHRGGNAGFVEVTVEPADDIDEQQQQQYVSWREYAGNGHFNTLGNLILDPRMGIAIPDFVHGGLLQISGVAELLTVSGKSSCGEFQVKLRVQAVNEMAAGSLPIRWKRDQTSDDNGKMQLVVSKIEQESENVKSFYLQHALEGGGASTTTKSKEYSSKAGQYLPIELTLADGQTIQRTYSLSSYSTPYYRISVKKIPNGTASAFLHESVRVGDMLRASPPAGDFTFQSARQDDASTRPLTAPTTTSVFLSSGIGVTPLLAMLECASERTGGSIVWMYGAKNARQHPFRTVTSMLLSKARSNKNTVQSRILYSQPVPEDGGDYDASGRIQAHHILPLVPQPTSANFYLCGPQSFVAEMRDILDQYGVPDTQVYFELF